MESEKHVSGWDIELPAGRETMRPPRRSLLFMPGGDLRKIEKACTLPVDGVIMDLEDGVAAGAKEQARGVVVVRPGRQRSLRVAHVLHAADDARRRLAIVVPTVRIR